MSSEKEGLDSLISQRRDFSSLYKLDMRTVRGRRKWYGWLLSIQSVERDLLRPGFVKFWERISPGQRTTFRDYIRKNFGFETYDSVVEWVKEHRKDALPAKVWRKDKAMMLAMNQQLADHTDKLVMIPMDGLPSHVLFLRGDGRSVDDVAEVLGIDPLTVERIATPEAMRAFNIRQYEYKLMEHLKHRMMIYMEILTRKVDDVKLKEAANIFKLALQYESMEKKRVEDATPVSVEEEEKKIGKRLLKFMKKKDVELRDSDESK